MSILSSDPRGRGATHLADAWSGTPPDTFWAKWFGGILFPLILAAYGVSRCVAQQAVLPGRGILYLNGRPAVAMGVAVICAGCFLHFHYFWGNLRRLCVFSDLGKMLSLLGFIGAFGFVLWSVIMG